MIMASSKIKEIKDLGQSIWLDYFDRKIMDSGQLKRLIENTGIAGITSNPSIFQKAIETDDDYYEDIRLQSQHQKNNEVIFFSLAIQDVKRAADLFMHVYEKSSGEEGLVSIEVSPRIAYNTNETIKQARELWSLIDRRNVMIKIPATLEGLPAIRTCISEGININVTLLFGLPRYRQVAEAYISGLEDRIKLNKPVNEIVSVASFFLSRIDVLTDPLLEDRRLLDLKGEVAIASAKMAYRIYKTIYKGERFGKLALKGAKRQQLLWASTSSKDPSFSDVKYVEELIGKDTINTLPLETIEAFNDHGRAVSHLEDNMEKATAVLAQLDTRGIDINMITQKLEDDGIKKINKSYNDLLETIEKKKNLQMT